MFDFQMATKKTIKFVTVKLIDEKYQSLLNTVVIVPITFLTLTNEENQGLVRYLEPPHSQDDQDLLKTMFLIENASPPECWVSMLCRIGNDYGKYLHNLL